MNEQFINDLSKELAKLGTIHSVGEEWISYTGKIPSGGIPYCGQEVTRETYSALWSWAQAQGLVKAESEWQSIASSQNGNVPFYSSGNGTTTFRMPKLVGYVKGASSQSESGSYVAEGLPNITGAVRSRGFANDGNHCIQVATGSFYEVAGDASDVMASEKDGGTFRNFVFDASRSSSVYGNSDHVTPETSVVMFGVYAFGTVSNPNDLNVSNLAADIDSIKTSYLPLSGGTMTGSLKTSKGDFIYKTTNDGFLSIGGGTISTDGARLTLNGQNRSTNAGQFVLLATDGTNTSTLAGKPNGTLTWGGKNVVRSVNNTTADANGNVTVVTGTVSQKYNKTSSSIAKGAKTTVSITGLTANKPLHLLIKSNTSNAIFDCVVTSGLALVGTVASNSFLRGELNASNTNTVIPNATSISLVVQNSGSASGTFKLVAYQ